MDQKHNLNVLAKLGAASVASGALATLPSILSSYMSGGPKQLRQINTGARTSTRRVRASQAPTRSSRNRRRRGAGNGTGTRALALPAAIGFVTRSRGVAGMSNFRTRFEYLANYVYLGNGSLGSAGSVYALNAGSSKTIIDNVPVSPPDTEVGMSIISDIWKHFPRKRYHKIALEYRPWGQGTSSASTANITLTPLCGGGYTFTLKTDATAPFYGLAANLGTPGTIAFPSWQTATVDLTKYICSLSGTNDFTNSASSVSSIWDFTSDRTAPASEIPCAYRVGGNGGAVAGGSILGLIVISVDVTLEDFQAVDFSRPQLERPGGKHDGPQVLTTPDPLSEKEQEMVQLMRQGTVSFADSDSRGVAASSAVPLTTPVLSPHPPTATSRSTPNVPPRTGATRLGTL